MNRLRAEFRGLKITERGRTAVDAACALFLLAGSYFTIVTIFPACP